MDISLDQRKSIWHALSELYLDTELIDLDYRYLAIIFLDSNYAIDEIKEINRVEVFPVLYYNLISVMGIWSGFDEDVLTKKILKQIKNQNGLTKLKTKLLFWSFAKSFEEHFVRIEKAMEQIRCK